MVGETALMNDHSCNKLASLYPNHNGLVRHGIDPGKAFPIQLQEQIGSGQFAGNSDGLTTETLHVSGFASYHQGTAPPAYGSTGAKQSIALRHQGKGVNRDLGELQGTSLGIVVEGFYIFQGYLQRPAGNIQSAGGQSSEDKGVVRTWGEPESQSFGPRDHLVSFSCSRWCQFSSRFRYLREK